MGKTATKVIINLEFSGEGSPSEELEKHSLAAMSSMAMVMMMTWKRRRSTTITTTTMMIPTATALMGTVGTATCSYQTSVHLKNMRCRCK
jgi:hypothetical protein